MSRTFRYLIIFSKGERHELVFREWLEFSEQLNRLVFRYGLPDLIYQVHS